MEIYNSTADQDWISFWHHPQGDCGSLNISSIWYMTDGSSLSYPEVAHVDSDTFVCTVTNNDDLLFAVTYDGGATWDGLWNMSGIDYQVIPEYRCCDISGDFTNSGTITVWEHDISTEIYDLILDFTTAKFEGYVWFEEEDPVIGGEVWPVNKNLSYPFKRMCSVYTDDTGKYTKNLILDLDVDPNAVLEWFATDGDSQVGIMEQSYPEVTTAGCATYANNDIFVDIHYRDLKDFPFYWAEREEYTGYTVNQMTGAAVAQMMLNYVFWNNTIDPLPPLLYDDQVWLFETFNLAGDYINATEMQIGLNNEIPGSPDWEYGYWFGPTWNDSALPILERICVWIDYYMEYYEEQGWPKEGHPSHVPVAVPAYGSYGDWIVARGIHTNKTTWPPLEVGPFTVYGLWVNDPYKDYDDPFNYSGAPGRTYITADTFLADFLMPINDPTDRWYGKYLAIIEPPEFIDEDELYNNADVTFEKTPAQFTTYEATLVQRVQDGKAGKLTSNLANQAIANAAVNAVKDVVGYDSEYSELLYGIQLDTIKFNGETYTVTFSNNEASLEVVIGAKLGELHSFTLF
jgi:hypothetical protein